MNEVSVSGALPFPSSPFLNIQCVILGVTGETGHKAAGTERCPAWSFTPHTGGVLMLQEASVGYQLAPLSAWGPGTP